MEPTPRTENPGRLERLLGLFAEVRGGEGATVLLLAMNLFLILTAYYVVKPVRESLILSAPRGEEFKSYAAAGQALLLLGAVPAYAWLAGRVDRARLIRAVTVFFAANLGLFYLLVEAIGPGSLGLGLGFFLWVGIFNLMVPAQLWSLANDVYTPEQGKRLFAIVAFGASAGAVSGSAITRWLRSGLGEDQLLLVAGAILLGSLLITARVERGHRGPRDRSAPRAEERPLGRGGAFGLVFGSPYLLGVAVLLLLLNWVNTTGEFVLGGAVKAALVARAAELGLEGAAATPWLSGEITRFYAGFYGTVNLLGVLVQLFLVSRLLRLLGVRGSLLVLPLIAMGGYAVMAFVPVLGLIRWTKTAENATDYSLQNTVRQALFLPTTREEKYKAKQAIDTFFVRAGDVLSALLVYVGVHVLTLSIRGFALVNLGLVVAWLLVAVRVGVLHRRRTAAAIVS